MLLAETAQDMEVLTFLYDESVCFGMWKLYNYAKDKTRTIPEAKFIGKNFPLAQGLAYISLTNQRVGGKA